MSASELERLRQTYAARQDPAIAGRYAGHQPGERYGLERRRQEVRALLRRHLPGGLAGLRVLDVGCGRGQRLAEWTGLGADPACLTGVDLFEPFIRQARGSHPDSAWAVASGHALPFADGGFDLVTQAMTVSSVLDEAMRRGIVAEMWRVLRPGGLILWYDMRFPNPWNPDMRPIRVRDLANLFPAPPLEMRTVTLLPPLARRLAPWSATACRLLEAVPPLRSHCLAVFRKGEP